MTEKRSRQFGLSKLLLWTAVVAVAAGLVVLTFDGFGLVESFSVVATSPEDAPVAAWLSRIYFAIMLVAFAVGILWFCIGLIRRPKKNDHSNSPKRARHDREA